MYTLFGHVSFASAPISPFHSFPPVRALPPSPQHTLFRTRSPQSFTTFGKHYEVIPEDYQFGQEAAARTPDLITKYNIKANPIDLRGGLDAVQEGLDFQKVSCEWSLVPTCG